MTTCRWIKNRNIYKYTYTHPPSTSLAHRTCGYLPNGWNWSWLYSSFSSPYMDCTGKTISFEMQRAYPKRTGRVEIFAVLTNKSFPLRTDVTARWRSMHWNSQLFIGDSAAILHYTASWRHFRGFKHQKRFSERCHLSELHRKLATMFRCDANMTSLLIWLTSANSFLIHSVIFESSNGGRPKPRNNVEKTSLPDRIFKYNLAW